MIRKASDCAMCVAFSTSKRVVFELCCLFLLLRCITQLAGTMYLHYYLDENKKRVYTFKKVDPNGCPTIPAHPARYSVGNEMSKERILIKKRFNILLTQGPSPVY